MQFNQWRIVLPPSFAMHAQYGQAACQMPLASSIAQARTGLGLSAKTCRSLALALSSCFFLSGNRVDREITCNCQFECICCCCLLLLLLRYISSSISMNDMLERSSKLIATISIASNVDMLLLCVCVCSSAT